MFWYFHITCVSHKTRDWSTNETPKIELIKPKKTVKWVDKISGYENYEKESFKPNNLYENSKRNILNEIVRRRNIWTEVHIWTKYFEMNFLT